MLMSVVGVLFFLGVLILVHEFGHFLMAKRRGVRVERFAFGLGPKLVGCKRRDTEYLINLIPFGGYVKMAGGEFGKGEGKPYEFTSKSPGARMSIIAFGPAMNFLLGYLIFAVIFMVGAPYLTTEVGEVKAGYPAAESGLKPGDKIIAIDGKEVKYWQDMTRIIYRSAGKQLKFTVEREGKELTFFITPREEVIEDVLERSRSVGLIGITPSSRLGRERLGFFPSLYRSAQRCIQLSVLTLVSIGKVITGQLSPRMLAGPVFIIKESAKVVHTGAGNFFSFIGLISVALGVFNLLPFPVLDGGHLFFLTIEKLRGRPINERIQEVAQQIGVILILALMLFVTYNDITRDRDMKKTGETVREETGINHDSP